MYMDDTKLFAKNENELESPIHAVRIYSQDIGIEFGIKMRHFSNEKWQTTPNARNGTTSPRLIWTLGEKAAYKYLGIFEADTIKQMEMKEKN